jgi:AraC-like DNA-binding protein
VSYFFAACGAIILFFILQIIRKGNKEQADYLLIGINVIIGIFLLADVLVHQQLSYFTISLQNAVPLFLYPLVIIYILQFVQSKNGINKAWYATFIPGILFLGFSIIDYSFLTEYDATSLREYFERPSLHYQLFFKGGQIMFILSAIWLLRQFPAYEQELKRGYSFIETVDIHWLRNFTFIYLISIALIFFLFLFQNLGWIPLPIQQIFAIVYGILVLSVFYLNYEGIRHYTLAQEYPRLPDTTPPVSENVEEKEIDIEKPGDLETHRRMKQLFEEKKVYLVSKYGLRDLANDLNESPHHVSRVLNAIEKKSFYDFVNEYRVAHLQSLLKDPKYAHLTILALGLESGFNSKASINRNFKQVTGITPKQYLQQTTQPIN